MDIELLEEMKELYLQDLKPWIVSFSSGKDSSLCLEYTFQMLESLPLEKRHKPVYVLMVNTLAETPMMHQFMVRSMEKIRSAAREMKLPVHAEISIPEMKDRFFYNTLGRGLLVITPKKKGRWCSMRMKAKPVSNKIKEIIVSSPANNEVGLSAFEDGQTSMFEEDTTRVVQILGTRVEESVARAASIRKHEIKDTKFSRHSQFVGEVLCYMPIKYMTTDEVFLSLPSTFSWGIDVDEMMEHYARNFLECGLQDGGEEKQACGVGSRTGCWVCPAMGLNSDKMLEGLIKEGHTKLSPLYEWKQQLIEIRNDVRFREFERRQWRNQHKKRLVASEKAQEQVSLLGEYFDQGFDVEEFMKLRRATEYERFDRAEDTDYTPGGLSVEGRKLMLEKLLYIQKETGYELISEEEVNACVEFWNEEGYLIKKEEVLPLNNSYDGSLVFKKDGSLNRLETTTVTPKFEVLVDFEYGRDEMVKFIESRKKKTGQSYYYFTTHWDMGEEEQFVWNQAVFVVCRPGIKSEEEAKKVIQDWLNPEFDRKQEDPSFAGTVKRRLEKVYTALKRKEILTNEVVFLIKAKEWITIDSPHLVKEIDTLLSALDDEPDYTLN